MVSNMDKEPESAVDENGRPEDHARSKNKKKKYYKQLLRKLWKLEKKLLLRPNS